MKPSRIAIGVLLLVLAVVAALFASDVRGWRAGVRAGDLTFARDPAGARWTSSPALPGDPALRTLGISGQLALRRAMQSFVAVNAAGCGFDNCTSEAKTRGDLEGVLTTLANGPNRARNAQADNLLGILAYADSRPSLGNAPTPVDQSVGDFKAAVQLDPASADAKYNLEWLLQQLASKGTGKGPTNLSSAPGPGRDSAGGIPGHGY